MAGGQRERERDQEKIESSIEGVGGREMSGEVERERVREEGREREEKDEREREKDGRFFSPTIC